MSGSRKKRRARSESELIGWYHSHPDAPARPSEFDREHAWPWYSYIIVSVQKGEPRDTTSWRLHDDRAAYDAEAIEIVRRTPRVILNQSDNTLGGDLEWQ